VITRRLFTIIVLGSTQTLAWASSYYLPAVLADEMSRDLGLSTNWIFGIFSASLILTAVMGPKVGRTIDAWGAEYWYYRLKVLHDSSLWNVAQQEFSTRQP